jgi:D-sedoheptulose 7-phosphate isomerase
MIADTMSISEWVRDELLASADVKRKLAERSLNDIVQASLTVAEAFQQGGKVLLCGNGGSAADAQHLAGEFVCRLKLCRSALPALALTTNTSILTAWGNDESFRSIFSRQVEAFGRPGDVLIAISTSGNSANVLHAAEIARKIGLRVIGMTGAKGAKLAPLCDICLRVPSDNVQHIQECHITIGHIICSRVEHALFCQE